MTREKEIFIAASKYIEDNSMPDGFVAITDSTIPFIEGAEWADNHPKSPWISVENDLPCNRKELLLSTECHTVGVFTYKKGGACGIDNMIIRNGKWEWEAWKENYLYWMPIPKLPK